MPLHQALMVQQWLKTDSCPKVFFKKAVLESVLIFKEEHYSEHFQTLPFGKCNNVYSKTSTIELVFFTKVVFSKSFLENFIIFAKKHQSGSRVQARNFTKKRTRT